jgi:quinol monooxygenase YgiN
LHKKSKNNGRIDMVLIAKIKSKSGEEEKIENAFRDVMPKVAKEEGTLAYSLIRSQADPTSFIVYEKYKDIESLMEHGATPYLKEVLDLIGPLCDGDLAVDLYDEVAEI